MIRGTTPTHTFNIPFDTSLVSEIKITYAQNDNVIFTKNITDCVLEDNEIKVTLTQQDTFAFDSEKKVVQIQLRVLTKDGEVLSSLIEKVGVSECLDNEVLG